MVASTVVPLTKKSQQIFVQYYRSLQSLQNVSRTGFRSRLERIDREYQREMDLDKENERAKAANRNGDADRLQNITVPVIMPQVEAAVTHQAGVYLTDTPLFGVVSEPKFIDESLQLESVLQDNSIRGGWTRELMMFFRDGFKYNFAPLEVSWGQEVTYSVETNVTASLEEGTPKEVIWSGNKLRRLDPYNTFVDTRVAATEVYKKGEFAGFTEFMSRIELKAFIATLPDKIIANIKPAFESGLGSIAGANDSTAMNFYLPSINPDISESDYKWSGTNWMNWAGLAEGQKKIDYKDGYEVTTLYCKILPSEFDLKVPNSNTPQIYKLLLVNHEHIIYAELQTNAHNYLPIMIGSPLEDGLEYQTKSLADNGSPFQSVASAYMNSIIASRRRAISDRTLYDPSRITSAHINSANPSAKIPVRPAAYGKNIAESVYAFPYREDQAASSMAQVSTLIELSNKLSGQNQVQQGGFVKGNKTDGQFAETMQSANGRDQLASLLLEAQCFIPMKLILKLNTLQFQGGTTVYNRDKQATVKIDPVALRQAVLEFKVSDGMTSKERILKPELLTVAIQAIGSSPDLAGGYNLAPMFSYLMKSQGAPIADFEKSPQQIAYEQALGSWNSLAQLAIEKVGDDGLKALPPQPLPEAFGYDPAANNPQNNKPAEEEQTQPDNSNLTGQP
jgi:hypothetical protein